MNQLIGCGTAKNVILGRPFVRPMLSDRCLVCMSVSVLSVCDVGALWPNGWNLDGSR